MEKDCIKERFDRCKRVLDLYNGIQAVHDAEEADNNAQSTAAADTAVSATKSAQSAVETANAVMSPSDSIVLTAAQARAEEQAIRASVLARTAEF